MTRVRGSIAAAPTATATAQATAAPSASASAAPKTPVLKAVAVLSGLLDRPDGAKLHAEVIRDGGPTLLKLLALQQPKNHDLAYAILEKLSGKDLGDKDHAAWQKWLDEQRTANGATAKP